MQLIPAIDLLGDDAVRLEQGDYDRVLFRQPLDQFIARVLTLKPDLLHVVDLQGAREGALRTDIIARCRELARGVPLQVSGGIRSLDAAQAVLEAGAQRVILGTALWSAPDSLGEYVAALGPRLVAALDIRDGRLAVRGWLSASDLGIDEAVEKCMNAGVARLHVTAISRDGTMSGPDLELYSRVCTSGIKVVAAGGVRNDDDLNDLEAVGCEAAVMGLGLLTRLGITL